MDYVSPADATTPYGKLTESIQVYLNRYDEDTLARVPLFINNAEKALLRVLRMPSMEKMVVFTLKDAGDNDLPVVEGLSQPNDWIRLPTDYIEVKFIWTSERTASRVTFDRIIEIKNDPDYGKTPDKCEVFWAINAGRLFVVGVEQDTEVFMTYYADFPELSNTTTCNPLLQLLPDAMLYMAVAEGFRFIMEEERSDYWEKKAVQRAAEVQKQIDDAEFAGGSLKVSWSGYPTTGGKARGYAYLGGRY